MGKKIGQKLKKIREARNLSTSQLAKICGIHQTTISSIELGKHKSPGIDTIEQLAKALKISPLYFFEERAYTIFDLSDDLPDSIIDFLLNEESLPYLMLSKDALQKGISSDTLEKLLEIIDIKAAAPKKKGVV